MQNIVKRNEKLRKWQCYMMKNFAYILSTNNCHFIILKKDV